MCARDGRLTELIDDFKRTPTFKPAIRHLNAESIDERHGFLIVVGECNLSTVDVDKAMTHSRYRV